LLLASILINGMQLLWFLHGMGARLSGSVLLSPPRRVQASEQRVHGLIVVSTIWVAGLLVLLLMLGRVLPSHLLFLLLLREMEMLLLLLLL
jgi:hypothetical protein